MYVGTTVSPVRSEDDVKVMQPHIVEQPSPIAAV